MTFRAQIEALLATDTYPGDAEAAEMVGCSPVTAEDYRQRYRREKGEQHENSSGIMSPDAVDLMFEAHDEGLSWAAVAREVNEIYGLQVTANQCGGVYRRGGYKKLVLGPDMDYLGSYTCDYATPVPRYTFPLRTTNGTMHGLKVTAPKFARTKANKYKETCDFCEHLAHCLAHPGDVCWCETAQVSEVIE